jgi:hypothetical protein
MKHAGCQLDESFGEVEVFDKAVEFTCLVKGVKLKAKVIASINNPMHWMYRISFSNGYTSDFYCGSSGKWWDAANDDPERKITTPYPFAIQQQLTDLSGLTKSRPVYCFQLKLKGIEKNVFVAFNEDEDEGSNYSVRYDGDYRFSLKRKGHGWEVYSIRKHNPEFIDQEFARNICLSIEAKEEE